MTDEWNFYPCQMGEHAASVFYDEGIAETLDSEVPTNLLAVRLPLRAPYENGLSSNEEFDALNAFEDDFTALVEAHAAVFVGRITMNGHRHFFVYTAEGDEDLWAARIRPLGESHGYALALYVEADPTHRTYWTELYPKDTDRRVMADISVLRNLAEHGDDGSAVRHVDHWAYFDDEASARTFAHRVAGHGFSVSACAQMPDEPRWQVILGHETALFLNDITAHTLRLQHEATALGGSYDGWETVVCTPAH